MGVHDTPNCQRTTPWWRRCGLIAASTLLLLLVASSLLTSPAAATESSRLIGKADESNKLDSDLVFDSLDHHDHRIARSAFEDSSEDEEEESALSSHLVADDDEEEHWLSRTVNRLRRSVGSLLNSEHKTKKASHDVDSHNHKNNHKKRNATHHHHKRVKRKHHAKRQNDLTGQQEADDEYENEDGDEEEDDLDEDLSNGQETDQEESDNMNSYDEEYESNPDNMVVEDTKEDEGPDYNEDKEVVEPPFVKEHAYETSSPSSVKEFFGINDINEANGNIPFDLPGTKPNDTIGGFGSDDEDLDTNYSGEASSGDGEPHIVETPYLPPSNAGAGASSGHPVYYRISFVINEPFKDEWHDRNSYAFQDVSQRLVRAVEDLYTDTPGTQSATVIEIEKRGKDRFTSKVTLDLGSAGFYNNDTIKDIFYKHVSNHQMLGDATSTPEDFQFRTFEGKPPVCDSNQISCLDGQCVSSEARCNGSNECLDGSDEIGCGGEAIQTPETTTDSSIDQGSGDGEEETSRHDIFSESSTSTSTTLSVQPHVPSKCRADDVVRCQDGSRSICADQQCDGNPDCDDGSDEQNCPSVCAEQEFSCDITRCIHVNKVCDGVSDCVDATDERNCPECPSGDIRCDNRCVPPSRRCDGVSDCSNGEDEANCQSTQCRSDQFSCGDGQCIEGSERCNGRYDCRSGADEQNCTRRCRSDEFTCGNGKCIPLASKCNRIYDCDDTSDEKNCPCKPTDFHCANGFCIPMEQRCDKTHNCQDGSDEIGCPSKEGSCEYFQWRCRDGSCIDRILRCNYQNDCPDYSDEMDCDSCTSDEFRCDNGTCINLSMRCDGLRDCRANEDEANCVTCNSNEFKCSSGDCIHIGQRCDKFTDCLDGSDEVNCNGQSQCAEPGEFECSAGFCIMGYKRCNGIRDCPSGNDEENCPTTVIPPLTEVLCFPNEFRCNDGACIDIAYRCDNLHDCRDKSDEINCGDTCDKDQVKCEQDGICAPGRLCDGIFDCVDGSDEQRCENKHFCHPGQFACLDGGCIDEHLRCDGKTHCLDGSDERECVTHCRPDEFRCDGGLCVNERARCNNVYDCEDRTDEDGCDKPCTANEFECSPNNCIDINNRCDGYDDCVNGNDEANCPSKCTGDEFQCSYDQVCIPNSRFCDGVNDCDDGSDEFDCPTRPPRVQCVANEFRCQSNDVCIPNYLACNGRNDCQDGSDERDCPSCHEPDWFQCSSDGSCIEATLRCDNFYDCRDFSDEQNCIFAQCRSNEFPCVNGRCIDIRLRCNRRNDCSDNSDEQNCPTERPPFYPPEQPTRAPPTLPPPGSQTCAPGHQPCRDLRGCITSSQICDGRVDCFDLSDEDSCGSDDNRLNLKTRPSSQVILENSEVVFECRDEGNIRARVHWIRPNGEPLPPGSRDTNGRLEMPNIKVEHSGTYICEAIGFPAGTPGGQVSVHLQVDRYVPPSTARPPVFCQSHEATCSNGDCIAKEKICDGKYDCTDGSDENRCNLLGCEPNQFSCANKRCVLKTWRCDGDDDCGDRSDEEGCATRAPGALCHPYQFACHSGHQCIPRSYHCDADRDCLDGSDEIGCSKPVILRPSPPLVTLDVGVTFTITCVAVGVPTPEISWRLNWGRIPPKCTTTSINGTGTLVCPNIQVEDQGAYSCEAINIKGITFAVPDTILMVSHHGVCPPGYFNEEAKTQSECIKCFCFGQSSQCKSADLFIYQFQPPFDVLKLLGVRVDPGSGAVEIRDEPIYRNAQPQLTHLGRNGVFAQLAPYGELSQSNLVPYFAMSEHYHGNQLKSYGGFLRFTIRHGNDRGYPQPGPTVILAGNGYTLLHESRNVPQAHRDEPIEVRFFEGEWVKRTSSGYPTETRASREEIMMALARVDNILIKLQYVDGPLNTTVSGVEMDSAAAPNSGLGAASYVEECECPVGYTGTSCERCAEGYTRHETGPWLGKCYRDAPPQSCPAGTYGDPARGVPCETCPCPLTSPSNQFARTCSLSPDGGVTCDCPPGYVGRRCEQCAVGYTGNPLVPGDSCRLAPVEQCGGEGAVSPTADEYGRCRCKDNVDGPTCNICKPNNFYLSRENQFGCISCFCSGVATQCTSSNWYRDQISSAFTTSRSDFKLIDTQERDRPIEQGITLAQGSREILYSAFNSPNVHYWSVPPRYLGNKITSYGGNLKYTIRYVPLPGGQSSRNAAADVELVSDNEINLLYFAREPVQPSGAPQTFVVPLLEQYWQRSDGQKADRAHLLMALADLKAIYIKATYNTNTRESALISVSLDIAEEYNTGSNQRALEVEQCHCPVGYKGLSCEDCDFGYTRSISGIYLGTCEPCSCNGNSNECDPEKGVCLHCGNFTTGEFCDSCLPGYEGDPINGIPCRFVGGEPHTCTCDRRGSLSDVCYNGACRCKANAEGPDCSRCRPGTFGLSAAHPDGCQECFCSGVARECSEGNLYAEQIPVQIIDANSHGFTLADQQRRQHIEDGFHVVPQSNEIGYTFPPSTQERLYWSLPRVFTGYQIKSYGGQLEFTQRYTQRPQAQYVPDHDVVIIGNGVTIYWTNPVPQSPDYNSKVSVTLSPAANWQRLEQTQGPRPASREDIITVLANIEAILIRAQPSSDTESSFLSDITLDTAVEQYTGQSQTVDVEVCRCPPGYRGTSCELCSAGHYRDLNDYRTGPLGSCTRCPCNNNEQNCNLGPDNRVVCTCLPGYAGRYCESSDNTTGIPDYGTGQTTPPPPSIVVTISAPKIEIYEVGSMVRVTCSARSPDRPVRVSWRKDGGVLPVNAIDDNRGLLIITNVRISDSGRYICEATDGYTVVTEDIAVKVGDVLPKPPQVVVSTPYVDVQEGALIEFTCGASGNPQPNLRLIRIDGQPLSPRHQFENGHFRIPSASKSDQAIYQCIATNAVGTDTTNVDVRVREVAGGFVTVTLTPDSHSGHIGETFTLRCEGPRGSSSKWSKGSGPLPYSSREDNGVLTVYQAKVEDSGVYVCTVTSYTGSIGSNRVEVRIDESSQGIYPTAKVTPEQITIAQGTSTELRCDATGHPAPTVKWTKVGSEMSPNIEQIGSVLHISNARVDDRGLYVCVTTNDHGLAQAHTVLEVERVDVPVLSLYPKESQTVTAGNSAIVQCRIEAGTPTPSLTWSRSDGRPLSASVEQMSGGALRFVQISPAEEGAYLCTAENKAGKATAIAHIIVHTQPQVWTVPNQDIVTVREGQLITLECHASGNPPPSVQWNKPEAGYPYAVDATRRRNQEVDTLQINSFRQQDEGLYICQASSEAGVAEKRVQLAMESVPSRGDITGNRYSGEDGTGVNEINPNFEPTSRPFYPRSTSPPARYDKQFEAPIGTRAELRCEINNIDNDREQIFVTWSRADNRSLPSDAFIRHRTLYIDNVRPESGGDYYCVGTTQRGDEIYRVAVHLEVLSPPRITLSPPRQVVHPGDNAYIRCSATGQQPITINWTPVRRSIPPSVVIRDGLIQFNNIQLSDAGTYRCSAINSAGEADAVAEVIVEENVHTPPASSRLQVAPLGSKVTLKCSAYDPRSIRSIEWYRDNLQLPRYSTQVGDVLEITHIEKPDEGRYHCRVYTASGSSNEDYIDLQVTDQQWNCTPGNWMCKNFNCIPLRQRCDGIDDCGDNSDEDPVDCTPRIRRGPTIVTAPPPPRPAPTLHISPPERPEHASGDNLELTCQSSEPGVITTWSKLSGWLADNVQSQAGSLRISGLRPENSGTYRCEATGHQGVYHKDYNLNVAEERKNEAPLSVKSAPQGASVVLECRTNLGEPISYTWAKQGENLPNYVNLYSRTIQLNDVSSSDAGTYVCSASNGRQNVEVPTVLVVTGIVPHFAQAPTSYLALPTLQDAFVQFNFDISIKPQTSDGLILYNGEKGGDKSGDFISLSLTNAVPEFHFNLGQGVTVIKADHPISLDQWHTIKVTRSKKKATMFVDGDGPYTGTAGGKQMGLDLSEPLYLGGVPNFADISPDSGAYVGMVGCISRLKIGHSHIDIIKAATQKYGVTTCETCSRNKCENEGVCQEALSSEGYSCICPSGFSGPTCNKLKGETCSPYACGTGRCVDTESTFRCLCPLGRSGRRCENQIKVNEPAFTDPDSYIAYPTPKWQRRFKVSLKIKPETADDGLILYSSETDEGHGDFVSIAIKDRLVEFTYSAGGQTTTIRGKQEVRAGEWIALTANRMLSEGRLIVNGQATTERRPGNNEAFNLQIPLYIGGVDRQNVKIDQKVGVTDGFKGCITQIQGLDIDILSSSTDAANVEECGASRANEIDITEHAHENSIIGDSNTRDSACASGPCRNGGQCFALAYGEYKCECVRGFSGKDCEVERNLCDQLTPCQNGGSCNGNTSQYECTCPLGTTGINCEQQVQVRNDVHFDGNGYLEFDKELLDHSYEDEEEIIALELSTNSSDGLVFWQGQTPDEDGQGQDYISLSLQNGYLEFSYDLGSGPAVIRNAEFRVNDGQRHKVILKRTGTSGSIEIDNESVQEGESPSFTSTLNCKGNIYLGGVPNLSLMTGGRFNHSFNGCIHGFELGDSYTLDLGTKALSGINCKPCSSWEGEESDDDNELIN